MIGTYRVAVKSNQSRKSTMLFALLRGVVMLLAQRLKVLGIEECDTVTSVRSDVVSDARCGNPALGLAHHAERVQLQLPLPQLEPGCRLVPPTILLRFLASAIASHGPLWWCLAVGTLRRLSTWRQSATSPSGASIPVLRWRQKRQNPPCGRVSVFANQDCAGR